MTTFQPYTDGQLAQHQKNASRGGRRDLRLKDLSSGAVFGFDEIGYEARANTGSSLDIKIWLRLLACSTQIEQQIQDLLRTRHGTSLARFDFLAQLERHPNGLKMNVLSRHLMVTGGNVTGLTDKLVEEGLVTRLDDPDDRRSYLIQLTDAGRAMFSKMATDHEVWLMTLFDGVEMADKKVLYDQLGALRSNLAKRQLQFFPK